ncbi:ABC transporter substrate-binding protein [Natronoglomus mannanivorans]|uniref:ABC transporter substrate-binding protein n=1 Tax=Natronoglomus mannanivorans TaxID=2979990 RepID=A0AAP2Z2F3_9EURY|nr:ABC transporter substrate-binding protein [Halobacteria archaeon AArc-xg1-1]
MKQGWARSDGRRSGARPRIDRRRFLTGLGTVGAGTIAGCLGDSTNDLRRRPDDIDENTWYTSLYGSTDDVDPGDPSGRLESFAYDVGFVAHPDEETPTYVLAEEVTHSESEISITLRPDLQWSTGDPLTADEVGRWAYMLRMGSSRFAPVPAIRDGDRFPTHPWETVTDITWDDRTVTLEGRFDRGPTPLYALNAQIARRPSTYYQWLWDAFRDAYDDVPWEDERTWDSVTTLVDSNIRGIPEDNRPKAGVLLEDEYETEGENEDEKTGWEAAFSGLWYPRKIEEGQVYFTVNDAHPFADRVDFEEIVWKYQLEADITLFDLRNGVVDGAMLDEVSDHVLETVPTEYDAFEGPQRSITTVLPNHTAGHLGNRDVRAALAYAIDREQLRSDLDRVSSNPISTPGADIQPQHVLSSEFRGNLRTYEYAPSRAEELLERAGFTLEDGQWYDPDDEPFEFQFLAEGSDPTFPLLITGQLAEFGLETGYEVTEGTSYQTQRNERYFVGTKGTRSTPSATGIDRVRTGEYARSIVSGSGFRDSGYLEREVRSAVETTDELELVADDGIDRLAFDSVEALRSITVEAPPFGEPDEAPIEWPYLYHAVRASHAVDPDEQMKHQRICTWIYNYQVPELELLVGSLWIFHRSDRWSIPDSDDRVWDHVRSQSHPSGLWAALSWGHVTSDGSP